MKQFKKFTQEMTGTSAVPGAGDDSSTVIIRKKYDKNTKRKDQIDVLKRFMEKISKKS
jgi:hypothetical protein